MSTHVKRAFKYRFYPTDAQAAELSRTFGCVRKVYNLALAARTQAWARQERVNYHQTSAMLTAWKKTEELAYLNEVSSVPLQQALRHLQTAFTHFFGKRARYPRFKSRKKSRRSAEYTSSAFRFRDGKLTLAKMTEPLDIVWSRPLPEGMAPSTVTVSQDSAGRWFVSLLCDDPGVKPLPATGQAVGVDVGLDHLLTLSTGEKIANPRHERRDRTRLAKAQRNLARRARGDGANRRKARLKVAKIHARIADRRRDTLHKLTTRLVRENQTIVIEDLTVRNMVKNHRLARAISDAAWSEFRSMLEYKAQWYGREVIAVDRWFPSSKLCSACNTLRDTMPLNVRTWTCDCGVTHDRDVNAANNLLAAGLAVTVCGAGVRPQRSTPDGQSATKQKPSRREP
ncbi:MULTISPECIES: RNA-guided endonuclease TnpB family protein [Streptomyces]|uniref:RNA-guided endonuclease TnpB family protein n=1 Tax=Streptomyces mirabilis TaxID=68239 RepID=A0ABU3V344_9ACTN|nr:MULTISPECIES: RNA-guided endonuclease TnpB family protein [Streptomyces]MCX4615331.1 transposase [Streptomyces mirabilis]MCX5356661.1 transposase [Streptomyces mirabilis]MDU9000607.1 RNA-guided endonuclease TnpB family protein [Streptomyces mirabilis]QDN84827.1 IS200/IS605 family element transposase accessory protein TnpB [Streptomyces sp. RLB3-6]QDO05695.1 IS200/IS605 family element transposase accessory protein TnpB [Streptomyces sp. S1D4-23]